MPGEEPEGHGVAAEGNPHRELLTVEWERTGSAIEVSVRGELDESTAPKLVSRIQEVVEPRQDLVIDMSGLTFCGSAGLSALILIDQQVTEAQGSLAVSRPTPFLVQLLEMAGLDGLIADSSGS